MNDGRKLALVTGSRDSSAATALPGDTVAALDLRNSVHARMVVAAGNGMIAPVIQTCAVRSGRNEHGRPAS